MDKKGKKTPPVCGKTEEVVANSNIDEKGFDTLQRERNSTYIKNRVVFSNYNMN